MPKSIISILLLSIGVLTNAQIFLNPLTSPDYNNADFLEFSSDPVSGATGETGVTASSFYPYSGILQNPSLLSQNTDIAGVNFTFTPWLRKLLPDFKLYDFTIWYPLSEKQSLAFRMRFFDMGRQLITSGTGAAMQSIYPSEYLYQLSYARDLTANFSAGISLKYFRSDIGEYSFSGGYELQPVNSLAFDIGIDYDKKLSLGESTDLNIMFGSSIRNFGPKIKYTNDPGQTKNFIPTLFAAGILLNPSYAISEKLQLDADINYQAEKYLTPTPPVYASDGSTILEGKDPHISAFQALYQSFYDSPEGFEGELREIIHKTGMEVRMSNHKRNYMAIRLGMIRQEDSESFINYNTFGLGAGISGFDVNFKFIFSSEHNPYETWSVMVGYQLPVSSLLASHNPK